MLVRPRDATASLHLAGYRAPERGDFQKAFSSRVTSCQTMVRGSPEAGTNVPDENAVAHTGTGARHQAGAGLRLRVGRDGDARVPGLGQGSPPRREAVVGVDQEGSKVTDVLVREGLADGLPDATQIVYVSPLKALSNDVRRNLEDPLGERAPAAVAAAMNASARDSPSFSLAGVPLLAAPNDGVRSAWTALVSTTEFDVVQ